MSVRAKSSEIFITEEDIVVYKILKRSSSCMVDRYRHYYSPFYPYDYEGRSVYKEPEFVGPVKRENEYSEFGTIDKGFHSYVHEKDAIEYCEAVFWNYRGKKLDSNSEVVRCVIPKGSRYSEGYLLFNIPTYVSDQIRLDY